MFFSKSNINLLSMDEAQQQLTEDSSIILIDVRSVEEYKQGHIPHSINIPLSSFNSIAQVVPNQSSRLFVYCLSGARSKAACAGFAKMGYTNITNIGGISKWHGETEKS